MISCIHAFSEVTKECPIHSGLTTYDLIMMQYLIKGSLYIMTSLLPQNSFIIVNKDDCDLIFKKGPSPTN